MPEPNNPTNPLTDEQLWGVPRTRMPLQLPAEDKKIVDEAMDLYDQVLEAQCRQSSE